MRLPPQAQSAAIAMETGTDRDQDMLPPGHGYLASAQKAMRLYACCLPRLVHPFTASRMPVDPTVDSTLAVATPW